MGPAWTPIPLEVPGSPGRNSGQLLAMDLNGGAGLAMGRVKL